MTDREDTIDRDNKTVFKLKHTIWIMPVNLEDVMINKTFSEGQNLLEEAGMTVMYLRSGGVPGLNTD